MKRQILFSCSAIIFGIATPLLAVAKEDTPAQFKDNRRWPDAQPGMKSEKKEIPALKPMAKNKSLQFPEKDFDLSIGIDGGYRIDDMKWNIAADPTGLATPNILSELTWDSIKGYQFKPHVKFTQKSGFLRGLHLEGSIYKSITFDGDNQDSDYLGNDRTLEFSRSNNDSDEGHAEGFDIAIGYSHDFADRRGTLARLTGVVGYSLQQQTFTMRNGNQTIATPGFTPPTGPFSGLDSEYQSEWAAPFVGAELEAFFTPTHRLSLKGKYYMGDYQGEARWNLRPDFQQPKSFEHEANATGFTIGAEYGWKFYRGLELTVSAAYQDFSADDGRDTVFLSSGGTASTRLNEVEWQSQQFMIGLTYNF